MDLLNIKFCYPSSTHGDSQVSSQWPEKNLGRISEYDSDEPRLIIQSFL